MSKEIQKGKRPRGLALLTAERRREIASQGGKTSQARGTAHQWTAAEASAAGKKGSLRYAMRKMETQQVVEKVPDTRGR